MQNILEYINKIETAENVKSMREPIADALQTLESNINNFTIDPVPINNSNNYITTSAVLSAILQIAYHDYSPKQSLKIINQPGTYYAYQDNAGGYEQVTVDIASKLGTIEINEDGSYYASSYGYYGFEAVYTNAPVINEIGALYLNKNNFTSPFRFIDSANSFSKIGKYAFYKYNYLADAIFPVCEEIDSYAFQYCSSLRTVDFPVCVSIEDSAFYNCSALTTISFPACTNIGISAFYSCSALTTASFPACTSIGYQAFYGCRSLISINFPVCTSIGNYAFYLCSALRTASFPVCTSIGESAFAYCYSLISVSFPTCTYIGSWAFSSCSALTTVSFPACVNIGNGAFGYCYSLSITSFPACRRIGDYAFYSCSALTEVNFPSCSRIGSSAFSNCTSLMTASFPVCSYIASSAFYNCQNLRNIYLMNSSMTRIPVSTVLNGTPYYRGDSNACIYIPNSLYYDYCTDRIWSWYKSYFISVAFSGEYNAYVQSDILYIEGTEVSVINDDVQLPSSYTRTEDDQMYL